MQNQKFKQLVNKEFQKNLAMHKGEVKMDLKKVGEINNIKDIPFDRHVIVSGIMSNENHGWIWRMPGFFIKNDNGIFFRNHNDMNTEINENTILSLNLLER